MPVGDHDFKDVEAEEDLRVIQQLKPGQCATRDELLFHEGDGLGWCAIGQAAAGLDLQEDQRVASLVPADDVYFPAFGCAEVTIENLVAIAAEIADGEAFAFAT